MEKPPPRAAPARAQRWFTPNTMVGLNAAQGARRDLPPGTLRKNGKLRLAILSGIDLP